MLNLNAMNTVAINAATGTAMQHFAAIVKQKLCHPVCQDQEIQPTFFVSYSLENQTTVGTTTFVELVVNGTIDYVPKGACRCNVKAEKFAERTQLIFTNLSATHPTPTISITQGLSDGSLADKKCTTAKSYQIATDVTVTAVWA